MGMKRFYNLLRLIRIITMEHIPENGIIFVILVILVGFSGLTVGTSLPLAGVGTSIGVPLTGCTLLNSVTTLITTEFFSKFKTRYTKLNGWINLITILYEKT